MKNLALSVDELTLEKAREAARERGTSLDALVRGFLEELAGVKRREAALRELQRLWAEGEGDSGGRKLTRGDAYEERT